MVNNIICGTAFRKIQSARGTTLGTMADLICGINEKFDPERPVPLGNTTNRRGDFAGSSIPFDENQYSSTNRGMQGIKFMKTYKI